MVVEEKVKRNRKKLDYEFKDYSKYMRQAQKRGYRTTSNFGKITLPSTFEEEFVHTPNA